MLKAVIVEDEARARRILESLLAEYCPKVEVLASVDDVPNGVKAINKHQPDLVFLDIEMPGYTGFQLFDFLEDISFEVVFTTAYNDYALKAFEVSAIAYLLKPIQIEQLIQAVERVEQLVNKQPLNTRLNALEKNLEKEGHITRIGLPSSEGLLFVEAEEVVYLAAEGAYTNVFLKGKRKIVVSKNLKQLSDLLAHPCFFRTHRSYLVNLNHVRQYVRNSGGYLVMDNEDKIPISSSNRQDFLNVYSN